NAAKHRAEHHQAQVVEQDDQRRNVLVDAKVPGDGGHGGGLEGRRFNGDKAADQQGYKYRPRIGYGCLGGGAVGEGYGHGTPYGCFWLICVRTGGCGRRVVSNGGAQRLPGLAPVVHLWGWRWRWRLRIWRWGFALHLTLWPGRL